MLCQNKKAHKAKNQHSEDSGLHSVKHRVLSNSSDLEDPHISMTAKVQALVSCEKDGENRPGSDSSSSWVTQKPQGLH